MLRRLHIRNYLLMEELDLELDPGLSVITGETGSGKSIVIGALALAMGDRADSGVLRDPTRRCVIELEADLQELSLEPWFHANELPYERNTLVRRQLEPGGRSRAFINDTPVRLEQLKELGSQLVHVHSQHHTLLLNDPRFQLGLVDHFAEQAGRTKAYTALYHQWRSVQRELGSLRSDSAKMVAELEFMRFQLNELEQAALRADEQEGIEQELTRAEHAGDLIASMRIVSDGIVDEGGALSIVTQLRQALVKTARMDGAVNALLERLTSVNIELQDIGDEASAHADKIELDPAKADQLRERLDLILRLQQKHRVKSTGELLALQNDLTSRIEAIGSQDARIPVLEKEEKELREEVINTAAELSAVRVKAAKQLGNKVELLLHELGMEHAAFQFTRTTTEPGPMGIDSIKAMFSANKDRAPAPLDKVASGGELSRVMLALISLAADSQDLPTVIFDEIDTGVSGEVADRVGTLMARMGDERQVLAITHLPQIASKAAHHLLVTKETLDDAVLSRITVLNKTQRVEAIAQMLSGRELTKAAMRNAKALLGER